MAYRQPRPPQPGPGGVSAYLPALTRFLRDFCTAAWDADRRRDAQLERIERRIAALEAAQAGAADTANNQTT